MISLAISFFETGKLIVKKDYQGNRPDFKLLASSEAEIPFNSVGRLTRNWLNPPDDGEKGFPSNPFINGIGEHHNGFGNRSLALFKLGEKYFLVQVQRRREHEIYGLNYEESIEISSRGKATFRVYQQERYLQFSRGDMIKILKQKVSFVESLVVREDRENPIALQNYFETALKSLLSISFQKIRTDLVSRTNDYVEAIVNIYIEDYRGTKLFNSKQLIILLDKLGINDKILIIDQVLYFLAPFFGPLSFSFDFISINFVNILLYDSTAYGEYIRGKEFRKYLDDISAVVMNGEDLLNRKTKGGFYAEFIKLPDDTLYDENFVKLFSSGVSVRDAKELSLLIKGDGISDDRVDAVFINSEILDDEYFGKIFTALGETASLNLLSRHPELIIRVLKTLPEINIFNVIRYISISQGVLKEDGLILRVISKSLQNMTADEFRKIGKNDLKFIAGYLLDLLEDSCLDRSKYSPKFSDADLVTGMFYQPSDELIDVMIRKLTDPSDCLKRRINEILVRYTSNWRIGTIAKIFSFSWIIDPRIFLFILQKLISNRIAESTVELTEYASFVQTWDVHLRRFGSKAASLLDAGFSELEIENLSRLHVQFMEREREINFADWWFNQVLLTKKVDMFEKEYRKFVDLSLDSRDKKKLLAFSPLYEPKSDRLEQLFKSMDPTLRSEKCRIILQVWMVKGKFCINIFHSLLASRPSSDASFRKLIDFIVENSMQKMLKENLPYNTAKEFASLLQKQKRQSN